MGLGAALRWLPASVGYLTAGGLRKLDTPLDILAFPELTLMQKWRLGNLVKTAKTIQDVTALDNKTAADWVRENCGPGVFENFFAPLLRGKFGDDAEKVSAAWLVGRIQFRAHRSWRGETLGYVEGGFARLVEALHKRVAQTGAMKQGESVVEIKRGADGIFEVRGSNATYKARTVITTQSPPNLLKIVDWPQASRQQLEALKFQKTVCVTMALRRRVSRVYWCNIGAPDVAFGVMLEHTNFFRDPHYPPSLLYLANYCGDETDPLWRLDDAEIVERYIESLRRHFGVDRHDVLWWKTARAQNSGLVYRTGTLGNIPPLISPIPGLFTVGMLRSFPERSINDAIKQGKAAALAVEQKLAV